MIVIDSHNHLGGPDKEDGTRQSVDEILSRMENAGVDMAIVFPFNEEPLTLANMFISRAQREHPDKLIGFVRLDPNDREMAILEARKALTEYRLKGIKLHPTAQSFYPDHPFVLRIIETAAYYDVPVVFDNGKPASKNEEIAKLAKLVPEAKIILAHMRGEKYIEVCEENENLYLGTVKAKPEDIVKALDVLGAEKLIAGSDTPYADMKYEMRDKFEDITSEKERELILGKNIAKLMNLSLP